MPREQTGRGGSGAVRGYSTSTAALSRELGSASGTRPCSASLPSHPARCFFQQIKSTPKTSLNSTRAQWLKARRAFLIPWHSLGVLPQSHLPTAKNARNFPLCTARSQLWSCTHCLFCVLAALRMFFCSSNASTAVAQWDCGLSALRALQKAFLILKEDA